MQPQLIKAPIEKIESVMNQRMRVLNALEQGRVYRSHDLAKTTGLPVTRVRSALKALYGDGMLHRISFSTTEWPCGPWLVWALDASALTQSLPSNACDIFLDFLPYSNEEDEYGTE